MKKKEEDENMKKKLMTILTVMALLGVMLFPPINNISPKAEEKISLSAYATKKKVCYIVNEELNTDDITLQVYWVDGNGSGVLTTYTGDDLIIDTSGVDLTDARTTNCQTIGVLLKSDPTCNGSIRIWVADEKEDSSELMGQPIVSKVKTNYYVGDTLNVDDIQVVDYCESSSPTVCRVMSQEEYTIDTSNVDMSKGGDIRVISSNGTEDYISIYVYLRPIVTEATTQQPVATTQQIVAAPKQEESRLDTRNDDTSTTFPLPKKISRVKARALGQKKVSVTWKRDKNAYSYKVQISTKKNFKNAKSKTTYGTKYVFKNLKKKKTYYVRVRACALDVETLGKRWASWSGVKKIKVK